MPEYTYQDYQKMSRPEDLLDENKRLKETLDKIRNLTKDTKLGEISVNDLFYEFKEIFGDWK